MFENLFKLILVLGLAYLFYLLCLFLYRAGQSVFAGIGWVFEGSRLDTLRRILYLVIITGYVASIYYLGFMWSMLAIALVLFIACYFAKDCPARRLFGKDIVVATGKLIAYLCGFILLSALLYYFFSDVSVSEVGISGVFLGLWDFFIDVGKFILAVFALLIFLGLFGSGGGRRSSSIFSGSGGGSIPETQSAEFLNWERNKAAQDNLEERRGKP